MVKKLATAIFIPKLSLEKKKKIDQKSSKDYLKSSFEVCQKKSHKMLFFYLWETNGIE